MRNTRRSVLWEKRQGRKQRRVTGAQSQDELDRTHGQTLEGGSREASRCSGSPYASYARSSSLRFGCSNGHRTSGRAASLAVFFALQENA
jgi:hypothetical protein